jgi:predicted nucleic acid-binding Zn ribbon protein
MKIETVTYFCDKCCKKYDVVYGIKFYDTEYDFCEFCISTFSEIFEENRKHIRQKFDEEMK